LTEHSHQHIARAEVEQIAQGSHERVLIDQQRFLARAG
jgi:predicted thioesterase